MLNAQRRGFYIAVNEFGKILMCMYQPTNACGICLNNWLETLPLFMHMAREQPTKPEGQAFYSSGLHSNMAYLIYCMDAVIHTML